MCGHSISKTISVLLSALYLALTPSVARAQEPDPIREGPSEMETRTAGIGERIGDLEIKLLDGRRTRLSSIAAGRPLLVAIRDVGCPLSKKYGPRLAQMENTLSRRGIALIYINLNESETLESMQEEIETYGFQAPYGHDPEGHFGRALRVTRTTDVFLLSAQQILVYRGAIDDQYGLGYTLAAPRRHYLRDALQALFEGRPQPIPATTAPGCILEFDAPRTEPPSPPTYHREISRILQRNCQTCHRPGQSAPFSLLTWDDVKARRGMIRRVVTSRTMPPWFASKDVGHWANDRSLSETDRDTILAWAQARYPQGDPTDAPPPRTWPTSEWAIGKPDVIYQIPRPQRIPAEGAVPYRYIEIETQLEQDRWVQALEIRPTNPEVVHHVLVFLREGDRSSPKRRHRRQARDETEGFFAGMVPGQTHITYPDGVAKFLPRGSKLRFQIHYTVCGREALDQTRLGLRFASKPPRHEVQTYGIANRQFAIPPGVTHHKVTAEVRLPRNIRVYAFTPHMHVRGKAFRYEVIFPNGKITPLLSIPHYDFNWQLAYLPRSPIELARGWKVRATAWYDNGPENPANPDPTQTVRWGPQTWHEMMIGYVDYAVNR